MVATVTGGLMLGGTWERQHRTLPDLDSFLRLELPTTGGIYDARGELLLEVAREHRIIVTYDQIPAVVREAVLAVEDKNFFSHPGIDVSVLPRVVLRNLRAILADWQQAWVTGDTIKVNFRQGGSTITQQVVRSYFLADIARRENEGLLLRDTPVSELFACVLGVRATNKLWRKLDEMRLAVWLEDALTQRLGSSRAAKQLIFAHYANAIYLGNGHYGLAAAAEYYFGRPLGSFTDADADKAALLAATIKSPRDYAPTSPDAERVLRRRNAALALMHATGYLSAASLQQWQQAPMLQPALHAEDSSTALGSVFDELRSEGSGFSVDDLLLGKIRVHTTFDARVQRITEDAVEEGLRRYEKRHPEFRGQTQAAAVVLKNANANVLAEVGGRQFYRGDERRQGDFNRATQALRQPGSAFKPLVYLAAFGLGATLDTIVLDEPLAVATSSNRVKQIANSDHTFKGAISIRRALAESRNAATVWLAREVGLDRIRQTAALLSIQTPLQPYLSTALGSTEMPLVELANAYRALASGLTATPHVIGRLENAQGLTVFRAPAALRWNDLTYLPRIQEALRGVVRLPDGTAHALDGRRFPIQVMGKTGTTSDYRDAVFVGSTYGPDGITVAVWIGHDDQRPLGNGETGARTALPIFRDVMLHLYGAGPLGAPPLMPPEIDRSIDAYLAAGDEIQPFPEGPSESLVLHIAQGDGTLSGGERTPDQLPRSAADVSSPRAVRDTGRLGQWRCRHDAIGTACVKAASFLAAERYGRLAPPAAAVLGP